MYLGAWRIQKMKKAERLEEMISVFNSFPLNKENFEDFYVDTSSIRSVINARSEIINTLKYGINPYTKILLMGHKGSGKSTEMVKISEELKDQYEIINFSIAQEVELIGIQYIDVIFAVMSQIIEYLSTSQAVKAKPEILDKMTQYWKNEISIEFTKNEFAEAEAGGEVGLGFLKKISVYGKGIFKTGTETKKTIRKSIEPKISYLISLMNETLEDMNDQLKEKQQKELLIVVEDLDKLVAEDALKYMILKSGGAIRDLFSMLTNCAILELSKTEPQQISMEDATVAAMRLKSTYERFITSPEQFERLIEIYNDPHPENTDEVLSELLKTLAVIEYNGERWCGVHPVLVDFLREKGRINA